MKHKTLIVLDMDETLIYTEDQTIRCCELERKNPDLYTDDEEPVFFRPHVKEFIDKLLNNNYMEVAVFTASQRGYAKPILDKLFDMNVEDNLKLVFYRDKITYTQNYIIDPYGSPKQEVFKDLKKVKKATGYGFDRMVAVDDKMLYKRQRGNVIVVPDYRAELEDNILLSTYKKLNLLTKVENVRDYIKNFDVDVEKVNYPALKGGACENKPS